jgi:hypothetical protein
MKEIRKQKMKKNWNKKKGGKGLGDKSRPRSEASHGPVTNRNGVFFSLSR